MRCSHLKVPQRFLICIERPSDPFKLGHRHLGQLIVVHERATPALFAADDVAAGSFGMLIPVDTVIKVDGGVLPKRIQDTTGRCRRLVWQTCYEIGLD